jgi:hypothetical protein
MKDFSPLPVDSGGSAPGAGVDGKEIAPGIGRAMDPFDPQNAQHIVVEYARLLEADIEHSRHPGRADSLPYAKAVIKTAIRTSVTHLVQIGRLTDDLRTFLETAYTSIAEYLDAELVNLVTEYRQAAEQVASESPTVGDKTRSNSWRRLQSGGALAGEIARATSEEAEQLRREFQTFLPQV